MFTGESDVLGNYHRVKVDRVLYVESEIAKAIFASNDLKRINADLKREPPGTHLRLWHAPARGNEGSDEKRNRRKHVRSHLLPRHGISFLFQGFQICRKNTRIVTCTIPVKVNPKEGHPSQVWVNPSILKPPCQPETAREISKTSNNRHGFPMLKPLRTPCRYPTKRKRRSVFVNWPTRTTRYSLRLPVPRVLRVSPTEQARRRARMMERARECGWGAIKEVKKSIRDSRAGVVADASRV